MAFTALTAAQTDADSPLNETLFNLIRTNFDHIINAGTSELEAALVNRASLKSAQESVSAATPAVAVHFHNGGAGLSRVAMTFSAVGEYGFYPETRLVTGNAFPGSIRDGAFFVGFLSQDLNIDSGFATRIYWEGDDHHPTLDTVHARIRYIQATPDQWLGSIRYRGGLPFLYRVWDKDESAWVRSWMANDPPWYLRHLACIQCKKTKDRAKQDPTASTLRPHPFVDDMDQLPANHEIVLFDLRHLDEGVTYKPSDELLARFEARATDLQGSVPASLLETERRRYEELVAEDKGVALKRWEMLRRKGAMSGMDLLDLVNGNTLPGLDTATRNLSDDKTHPDNKHLPQIPGLFIPDTDGTPPKVRVMTQP